MGKMKMRRILIPTMGLLLATSMLQTPVMAKSETAVVYRDRVVKKGNKSYYYNKSGQLAGGFRLEGKKLFYFDPKTGAMRTDNDWVWTDRGWVYIKKNGEVYHNQLLSFGKKVTYYLDKGGSIAKGFRTVGGKLMYFGKDGIRNHANTFVWTDRGWVIPNAKGIVYRNQFISFGKTLVYYMGADGSLQEGMVEANGTVYNMTGKDGARVMKSTSYKHKGKEYFSDKNGLPYRDKIVTIKGKEYYYGKDGALVKKNFTKNGVKYTVNTKTGAITKKSDPEMLRAAEEPDSPKLYSLRQFKYRGVINWSGYKFTYYSQSVLPGGGLRIPGRHVNKDGYVSDGDGYIVLANSAPKGTVIPTPFGYYGKVYDRGTSGNHFDVYIK